MTKTGEEKGINITSFTLSGAVPSCECIDWQLHFMPCKHMLSVFRHFLEGWNSVSQQYRSFPLFVLDDSVVGQSAVGECGSALPSATAQCGSDVDAFIERSSGDAGIPMSHRKLRTIALTVMLLQTNQYRMTVQLFPFETLLMVRLLWMTQHLCHQNAHVNFSPV